jgi:hypothetical protein
MEVPSSLDSLSRSLLRHVEEASNHALLPIYRLEVYKAFGPTEEPDGRRRRGWLAIIATRHVLSVWRRMHPEDDVVERILAIAARSLHGEVDLTAAVKEADRQWDIFMDTYAKQEEEMGIGPLFVLSAALESLFISAGVSRFEGILLDESCTDADVDPWSGDAVRYAADAYAGPVWDTESDKILRLEFWRWWILTAIPTALRLALD